LSRKIVCTQFIVHTMLKAPNLLRDSIRRTHRTYTPEFKFELVAACQQPGVCIAALAGQHQMNANVLHRWLKEHEHSGRHALTQQHMATNPGDPAFIPLALPAPKAPIKGQDIRVTLSKGTLTIDIA
jgi:transposase